MKKIQKALSGLLAGLMLFTSVPVSALPSVVSDSSTESIINTEEENNPEIENNAISTNETAKTDFNNTEETLDSSEETEGPTIEIPIIEDKPTVFLDSEEDLEETDNWELGVVFYNSTVENGTKPLTEINWDASDGGYGEGTPRVITVQINYKNTNAVTTYQPGELEISIPNITYNNTYVGENSAQWKASVIVGANDSSHTGYPWNFGSGKYAPSTSSQYYYFYNAETIEEKANFEGSIQIEYTITPAKDSPEEYEDKCIHTTNQSITYELTYPQILDDSTTKNIALYSNSISFNYNRTYSHKWEKASTTFTKKAVKITSYDGLGENAQNYIWVKYSLNPFGTGWTTNCSYPYRSVYYKNAIIYDDIPSECKVYDTKGNLLTSSNGTYIFEGKDFYNSTSTSIGYSSIGGKTIYVGYPKSIYNEENNNLTITNTAYLYGKYDGELDQDYQYLNTASVTVNLAEFDFSYTGDLYSLSKNKYTNNSSLRYQDIVNNLPNNSTGWKIFPDVIYTGEKMTVKVGDDLLYALDKDNKYSKLNDNEYCFTGLQLFDFCNGNGNNIKKGKYNCELWVRYANQSDYTLYETFQNGYGGDKSSYYPEGNGVWSFDNSQKIVGFYFIFYDLEESLVPIAPTGYGATSIISHMKFFKEDIPESGQLYNFAYLQVFFRDDNNNLILQNEPDSDSYANYITKEEIANYDINTYGTYMQRAKDYIPWKYYNIYQPAEGLAAINSSYPIVQDEKEEKFTSKFKIGTSIINGSEIEEYYRKDIKSDRFITGFKIYNLLPAGVNLTSKEEDILNSLYLSVLTTFKNNSNSPTSIILDQNYKKLTINDIKKLIQNNQKITITENWHNTNRTKIEIIIDFKNNPILFLGEDHGSDGIDCLNITYNYNVSISYDDFIEYGSVYKNNVYIIKLDRDKYAYACGTNLEYAIYPAEVVSDEGVYNDEEIDINENGILDEKISISRSNIVINSIVSTFQDVQTQTSSTLSNYSTGTVPAEYGKDYSYKLRVRTGQNDVTNLIIYDNLEKWAKDKDGNFIESAGKKKYWQGEFLGVDTSYAESKGYTVKVWYSENEKAGTLAEDTSWKEYSDSVDKTKVKSLAFQYFNTEGKPAVLPANSLTYVVINMRAPADESITTFAYNGCWTQWNALDEFGQPVDFITGINSNIVKVALPNSVLNDSIPSIELDITKEIQGTNEAFENLKLDPNAEYNFQITLEKQEANEDGSHDIVHGLLSNKKGLIIKGLTVGSWLISEADDNYFDFVDIVSTMDPDIKLKGVTFEKTDAGYLLTITEDLDPDIDTIYSLKVINKIEPESYYEEKDEKVNLFNGTPVVEQ